MTDDKDARIDLTFSDSEHLWDEWTGGSHDLLARAAFEQTLEEVLSLSEDGLYFRPGGWEVNLPATMIRLACSASILAAAFQLANLDDVDRELVIASAGLVTGMDVRRVRITYDDRQLADRMRARGLEDQPVRPAVVHDSLRRKTRKQFSEGEIASALDRLVSAGFADRTGSDEYTLRSADRTAWIRVSIRG